MGFRIADTPTDTALASAAERAGRPRSQAGVTASPGLATPAAGGTSALPGGDDVREAPG
jgi:hypothetical protein